MSVGKPLGIIELLRRVGEEHVGVQNPLNEGTFLAANKRKGYTALEFATYPELAEEMFVTGKTTKTLLVLVMDRERVEAARLEGSTREEWKDEAEMWEREVREFGRPITPDHNHHEVRDWLNEAFAAGEKAVRAKTR